MSESESRNAVYSEAMEWYENNWDPNCSLGDWWKLLAEAGWAFPSWPTGFGGRGLTGKEAKAAGNVGQVDSSVVGVMLVNNWYSSMVARIRKRTIHG